MAGERQQSTGRTDCFRDLARARGFDVHEHYAPRPLNVTDRHQSLRDAWAPWLRALPKPVGLFCPRTVVAQNVVFAAHLEDIAVPEEIAVLGTGANDLECEMGTPPLSTIDTGSYRRGTEMARLLHRMMQGEPSQRLAVAPRGVVTRRSTDMLAIDNPDLAAALRYIRDHACDGTRINRLLEPIPMSRRSIEMGIKRIFGRTIRDEVVRIKIERAKELLVYSSMILPDIAERCGFAYASHLNRMFKQHVGMTPIAYRRHHSHE
ncbi:MAG: substrate-binding domain-containing protein [Phycisphaeraceae bacterium]